MLSFHFIRFIISSIVLSLPVMQVLSALWPMFLFECLMVRDSSASLFFAQWH